MEDITAILVDLFIIFAAAKLAGEVFARLRQPAIVGEGLVGIAIGPHALGLIGEPNGNLIELFGGDEHAAEEALAIVFDVLAELGVIILLFVVGLHTRLHDLMDVRGRAAAVGMLGIIFPFALGFALVRATGRTDLESTFVA